MTTSFPPTANCTGCGARWPAAVLDNAGHCAQCGLDGPPEFRRDRHGFPIAECHRCGGTGRYSFNLMHGDMCYGCSGSGLRFLVPKHHAAWRDAVRAAVRVVAQDLTHGDTVRPWGQSDPITGRRYTAAEMPVRSVIAIEVDHAYPTAWSTGDRPELRGLPTSQLPDDCATAWRTTITWDDGTVTAYNGFTLFHRVGVRIDPAPYVAAAERGARYAASRRR